MRYGSGRIGYHAPEREHCKRLAMHEIEIRGFKNGRWSDTKPPTWFDQVKCTDRLWGAAFADHGVKLVDEFNFSDNIEIYRANDATYCVVFCDTDQVILVVFIKAASDYIRFRAEFIEPNVRLMLASIQLEERDRARRLKTGVVIINLVARALRT